MSNENKKQTSLDSVSILKYSAYAAWVLGIIGSTMWSIGSGKSASATDQLVSFQVAVLLCGFTGTLVSGGILYVMAYMVSLARDIERNQEQAIPVRPNTKK